MTYDSDYHTSSLALATALSTYGHVYTIIFSTSPRAEFIFPYVPDLEELIDKYHRRELVVEPQTYFDHLKAIKSRLYGRE